MLQHTAFYLCFVPRLYIIILMKYVSTKQISLLWEITERRVRKLCADGRIEGAEMDGKVWRIPELTVRPEDARIKSGEYVRSGVGSLKRRFRKNPRLINNVYEADCLIKMKEIPNSSVDMILCDLPYKLKDKSWTSVLPLNELWKEYNRIIKPNGVIALMGSGVFTAELIVSNRKNYAYKYIWEKSRYSNSMKAKDQPLRKFEEICIFYDKSPTYHPQMKASHTHNKKGDQTNDLHLSEAFPIFEEDRYPANILSFKNASTECKKEHPNQKPVELGQYLIRTYTNPGELVLDNTCGSGSFLVAALLEGRNFIGIDNNEKSSPFQHDPDANYVEISKNRLFEAWRKTDASVRANFIPSILFQNFAERENGVTIQ